MSAPYSTLLLDQSSWDLTIDAAGNIARADPPYAVAQDVASAIKTFIGECYYDTSIGVPYLQKILGQSPPLSYLQQQLEAAALTVPTVVKAVCVVESFENRTVNGYVAFTTRSGISGKVTIP